MTGSGAVETSREGMPIKPACTSTPPHKHTRLHSNVMPGRLSTASTSQPIEAPCSVQLREERGLQSTELEELSLDSSPTQPLLLDTILPTPQGTASLQDCPVSLPFTCRTPSRAIHRGSPLPVPQLLQQKHHQQQRNEQGEEAHSHQERIPFLLSP